MAQFEQLQELWQHQPPRMAPVDAGSLTRALARFGRRQDWINLAKIAAITAVIGWEMAHFRPSAGVLAGLATVAAAALALIAIDWRSQRAISRLNFAVPSAAFVRDAIDRLLEQREPFRQYYWPVMLALVATLNLMSWSPPSGRPWWWRFGGHPFDSALPFAVYAVGRRFRARRFEAECRPLVNRLVRLLEAIEERDE